MTLIFSYITLTAVQIFSYITLTAVQNDLRHCACTNLRFSKEISRPTDVAVNVKVVHRDDTVQYPTVH